MEYVILSILILLTLISIISFYICSQERKSIFLRRCDRSELTLQDRPLTDFKNLLYENFEFESNKTTLRGRIYYKDTYELKDLIIFCHGYGAGHEAYITEIDFFTSNGFAVIGFDYRGCCISDGLTSHFGASIIDLQSLYNYLLKIKFLENKKVYLIGHSWGAYTSLCCSNLDKIEKVVALCPFNTPVSFLTNYCYFKEKKFTYFLNPFRFIYYKLKFGKYGNFSSFKQANSSNKKTLIIFGKEDNLIGKIKFNFSKNIKVEILEKKSHNPYNSYQAEEYLNKTLQEFGKTNNKKEFLKTIDYKLITQEDPIVMKNILNFLNQ